MPEDSKLSLKAYAGILENCDAVVSRKRENVSLYLRKCGAQTDNHIRWFAINISEDNPPYFFVYMAEQQENPVFEMTKTHWDRLFLEIYYFILGMPEAKKIKPQIKKRKW